MMDDDDDNVKKRDKKKPKIAVVAFVIEPWLLLSGNDTWWWWSMRMGREYVRRVRWDVGNETSVREGNETRGKEKGPLNES